MDGETYLLLARYRGDTCRFVYEPNEHDQVQQHGVVTSFAQVENAIQDEFGCKEISLFITILEDQPQRIQSDAELRKFVMNQNRWENLEITVVGPKWGEYNLCRQQMVMQLNMELDMRRAQELNNEQIHRWSALCSLGTVNDVVRLRMKLEQRIANIQNTAIEHYCSSSRQVVELLAAEIARYRAQVDALKLLETNDSISSPLCHVNQGLPHLGAAIRMIYYAAKEDTILRLQEIIDALPDKADNPIFQKIRDVVYPSRNAVIRELAIINILGALKMWMTIMAHRWANSGYVSKTSEIVLNPRRMAEVSESTRRVLKLLGNELFPDEPHITGISLELNPGIFLQRWIR